MEAKLRGFFTGILGVLSAWLGVLAVPVYMLVLCNLIDYLTGMAAAWKRGETISSYTGIQGIAKKISMWLLIGVGSIIDWLLLYAGNALHMEIHLPMLAASLTAVAHLQRNSLHSGERQRPGGSPPRFSGKSGAGAAKSGARGNR